MRTKCVPFWVAAARTGGACPSSNGWPKPVATYTFLQNPMITAVDTSALLSIFAGEPDGPAWLSLLMAARREGPLVICETVAAEVAPEFESVQALGEALRKLGVRLEPSSLASAHLAGQVFLAYRKQGGPREHLVPDFLIAAHAQVQADQLAADDRGYLRRYFPGLRVTRPPRTSKLSPA
jgi:predicted nucleic acid-binding protein